MPSPDLVWTKEMPTETGFYWVREGSVAPYVAHVTMEDGIGTIHCLDPSDLDPLHNVCSEAPYALRQWRGAGWYGPVRPGSPEPKEASDA